MVKLPLNDLFEALRIHDGAARALADAGMLCIKKAEDYNTGFERDQYFPLGLASYATILHMKTQRLLSLCQKQGEPNFESVRDTALDLINYASFLADWAERNHYG